MLGTRDATVRPVCVVTSLSAAAVRIADPPLRGFPTRVQNQSSKGRRVCRMVLGVSSRRPPGECGSKQSGAGPGDTAFQCIQDVLLHTICRFEWQEDAAASLSSCETLDRSFCSGKAIGFLIPVWFSTAAKIQVHAPCRPDSGQTDRIQERLRMLICFAWASDRL